LPRTPRVIADEDKEDLGEVFKEAREHRKAQAEKQKPRSSSSRPGERERAPKPRGPRPAEARAPRDPGTVANAPVAPVASTEEGAQRKRRRRRGGKRIAGAEGQTPGSTRGNAPKTDAPPAKAQGQTPESSGLLRKIGSGLRKLLKRSPQKQH
jgi:ATP-dependent RNA helicase RhlB